MIRQFLRKTCSCAAMCNVCHNYCTDIISSRHTNVFAFDVTFCATDYSTLRDTTSKKNSRCLTSSRKFCSRAATPLVKFIEWSGINRPLEKCHWYSRQENAAFWPRVRFPAVRDQVFHTTRSCCITHITNAREPVTIFHRVSKTHRWM